MLGDGSLLKEHHSRLSIGHCVKQKDYLDFKYEILKEYGLETKISHYKYKDKRFQNKFTEGYQTRSKTHSFFDEYREIFYPNNKKIIDFDTVKRINLFGLSIWFMDDGEVTNYSFNINTMCFTKIEVDMLRYILDDSFNIKTTSVKSSHNENQYKIYILSESRNLFIDLLEPYIIESMKYKLSPYYRTKNIYSIRKNKLNERDICK